MSRMDPDETASPAQEPFLSVSIGIVNQVMRK